MQSKEKLADVGVIVGRFQVEKLHPGHLELLLWVTGRHKKVIVVLGTPRVIGTRENPLDFQSRSLMIRTTAMQLGLSVESIITDSLADRRSDEEWSGALDELVDEHLMPGQTVTLYGCRESFLDRYHGKLPVQELVGGQEHWSGTAARDNVRKSVRSSEDFRAGVIWASQNRYPQVFPTVDVACFREGKLLLGRKQNETRYRLIGGFADPKSPTYEDDAIREVKEETGLAVKCVKYVGSCLVNDWRYGGTDKIKTLLFRADVGDGAIKANDDIVACYWAGIETVNEDLIVPEHWPLIRMLQLHTK